MSQAANDPKKLFRHLAAEKLAVAPTPRLSEVAAEFIELAGGPKLFAKQMWNVYSGATEGSITQQRMLALVCSMLKADEEITAEKLENMTEADLMGLAADITRLIEREDAPAELQPAAAEAAR